MYVEIHYLLSILLYLHNTKSVLRNRRRIPLFSSSGLILFQGVFVAFLCLIIWFYIPILVLVLVVLRTCCFPFILISFSSYLLSLFAMSNSTNTSKCKDPPLKRRKLEVQEELVATLIKSLTQIDSKGTNESSKEMFGCPMELRKPLLVEILEKEKPSLLRVALDHVIDLMQVAVKSKQTDSESPSSFLQDLLLIHKNIPYAEMILSERVASRIQLDATPEACLDILEEDTYNNSRLCRLFLLKHIA